TSLVANFTIASQTYRAIFKLHMPEPGSLMDNYTLWRADGQWASIAGAYNTSQDWIAMRLPKGLFAGIGDDVRLTNFWIMGRFGNASMDFAPNARDPATGSLDPVSLIKKVAEGQTVATPVYGADYVFGQYYHPQGSPGYVPSAPVPNIDLGIVGEDTRMIDPGDSTTYEVRVSNLGTAQDTVFLSLSSAGQGWSHQLSDVEIQLAAGDSRMVFLTVSAADHASEPLRSLVDASSQLGGSDSISFLTVLAPPPESSAPPSDESEPEHDEEPEKEEAGSPGFEFLFVALAVAGYAIYRRRN
ncbi:MAG TPA: hypothetical protein VI818_03940, partial [Candidatus Thermoplasmatota archaeon]|nr:hypothetical protein [Candidatus Thermoplasmatota archaeon]